MEPGIPSFKRYLAPKARSVNQFLTFNFPPSCPSTPRLLRVEKYYSPLPPTMNNLDKAVTFPLPPDKIATTLAYSFNENKDARSVVCPHVSSAGQQLYPIELAEYWKEAIKQRQIQDEWKHAIKDVYKHTGKVSLSTFQQIEHVLSRLPWTGNIPSIETVIRIDRLSMFLTTKWLRDDQELILLDLLRHDLTLSERAGNVFIENTAFTVLLGDLYANQVDYEENRSNEWVRLRGQGLASGEQRYLVTIVNHENIHWTGLIIDFKERVILHADSFHQPIPMELESMLTWWTRRHTGEDFTSRDLPVPTQKDSYSCGMLSWYAIHNYFFPGTLEPKHGIHGRIDVFLRLTSGLNVDAHVVSCTD